MRILPGLGTLPPAFHAIAEADRGILRDAGMLSMLSKGERLIRAGQQVDRVPFVYSGWVALEVGQVSVLLLRAGDAYLHPLDADDRVANIEMRAMSAASVALIDRRAIRSVLARYPNLLLSLIDRATAQMDALLVAQGKQASEPLEVRLAWLLWTLADPLADGGRRLPDEVPQAVLAGMLGASREEINRRRRLLMRAGFLVVDDAGTRLDPATALLLGAHDFPL